MKKHTFSLDQRLFTKLYNHLFPGDHDEHGAVIVAGISEDEEEIRFLGREVIIAQDGIDYIPGKYGYRCLTAEFVARISGYCAASKLCYFSVHCHGGIDSVEFSPTDITSHKKGYPALLEITDGGPVGALVFAKNAVAGEIWTPHYITELSHLTVIGSHIFRMYPSPQKRSISRFPLVYDRHVRMFGEKGQEVLKSLKVGIIGLGGGGSLLNEWIARLGIGHIIAIDDQKIEPTNLPRVVGATRLDAMWSFSTSRFRFLRKLGITLSRSKVLISKRTAKAAQKGIKYSAIRGNILNEKVAQKLKNCDFLFLATDNHQSRLVFNAMVQQYLIPGAQIGVKIRPEPGTQKIESITANTRLVFPYPDGGCLECHEVISPAKLQEESLSQEERLQQRYIDFEETPEPSVITLNAVSAAQAANDLMMMFTGLYAEDIILHHLQNDIICRKRYEILPVSKENCPDCSIHTKSRRAKGDRMRLPCKQNVL